MLSDIKVAADLGTLEEEGVPDVEVGADREGVHEEAEEPVEGEEGGVHAVGVWGCEVRLGGRQGGLGG